MAAKSRTADDIFVCQQCGDCCKGFGGTYVTLEDIEKISTFINCNPDQFTQKYCDPSGSKFVLTQKKDGYCIFFDSNQQCTIHPVKPYMCRAWPFIATIINYPENWDIMSNSCPGMKKDIPYKDLKQIVRIEQDSLNRSQGRPPFNKK
ncbi:MAG: YkgJ family cysteine cluster protein [Pseudomonadota bacterium]